MFVAEEASRVFNFANYPGYRVDEPDFYQCTFLGCEYKEYVLDQGTDSEERG